MDKPVIAITGPSKGARLPRFFVAAAVKLYGGKPLQLHPGTALDPDAYHGVVITGGHDVEPVLYAAEPEVKPNYDSERDALESAVIKSALASQKPLLGICRGAQLLNICLGGTLYQSLREQRKKTSHRWTIFPMKTLCILRDINGHIQQRLGQGRRKINSLHNQAINALGEDLTVSARDLDGIVQAIESPNRPYTLGVQWHPEFLLYLGCQRALFKGLVEHATRFQQRQAASQ
ncbi:gamma-glutamyl-gamma-aminobutyrate hydrolase family protein [Salinivibrio sp. DV]|uniref:gamma-glutamyl-gamma-aminobutyrate hydrolase family protein n=1 Tax=Salinivibrio sp. SS2 TaxID=1892894 RepID=UPI00084C650A|nr:gamma-glutamyl-gamma-aminobutyrate hydrolase family protein [Salinivibrio sp. DV]ODQ00649.1 peptidase C26 [Salinivibrio sp. DV]